MKYSAKLDEGSIDTLGEIPGLDALWMPFTDNRYFKANPRLLSSAKGMHYCTPDGRSILDGTAGLWCVNAGHGDERIAQAISSQASLLDFAPPFQLGHPKAFELAKRIATIMPPGLDRIFFTVSGSDAVDSALKIALAYHRARGEASRVRLIGRGRGYHGSNFGGTSVGGIPGNRQNFGAQVWGTDHLSHTHRNHIAFTRGMPDRNDDPAGELQDLIELHGADTIAAVIVEPVAASTGVLVPPRGYLQRLRELCSQYDILLIFDEVITAFGRLGAATGAEYFGVKPDLITMAKGVTNGTVPMGAVAADRRIYDAIVEGAAGPGIELPHGYTYSGHPLAVAAALATLDVFEQDDLFRRAASISSYWEDAVHSLASIKHVIDVRNIGLMAGIELEPRSGEPRAFALDIFRQCFDQGLLIRVTGETIALSPPLIISEAQIDEIIGKLGKIISKQ